MGVKRGGKAWPAGWAPSGGDGGARGLRGGGARKQREGSAGFFFLSFIPRLVLVIWLVGDSGRFKTGRRNLGHVARGGGARSSTIHAACGSSCNETCIFFFLVDLREVIFFWNS